ncbi:hypothetical protein [Chryseobacterium paridis]|uniref:Transcriptional regulator n=1 Tax=Chryseobacterium paridis TaxID=2800328 RepID=A0ABS1G0Q0_9FLAO|nr:hypothetical protein [Chryseobacterium paridis]MBK1898277.1 hypothetical protein [Chryseobacterium paridis]
MYYDEWEKLAKALDVPVENIKEEKPSSIVQNNDNLTFNDNSRNYNYYCSIPNHILDNLNDYIALLKKQNEALEEENKKLKPNKRN